MLDLIWVSSVLIVCSSLHFTWRNEGKKRHLELCKAPKVPTSPLCQPQDTSLSRLKTQLETLCLKYAPRIPGVRVW